MLSRRLLIATAAAGLALPARASRGESDAAGATLDRVRRAKVLRIAAMPGAAPYFGKDAAGAWSGMGVAMAEDIAASFDAKVEYLEADTDNAVGDLQAGRIDLALALSPTPKRALAVNFTRPFYRHSVGVVAKKGFAAAHWTELDKPEIRMAVEIGSADEAIARRCAGHATFIGLKKREAAVQAVQSGRAEAMILPANSGLVLAKKTAELAFAMVRRPLVQLPICLAVRSEPDKGWRDFLDTWIEARRGTHQIREWLAIGLALDGGMLDDLPADLEV